MTRPPPSPVSTASSAVLDLDQLPAYLTAAARDALRQPGDNLPLAAVSAGQLLRAGALRGAGRAHLKAWLAGLHAGAIKALGEVAEQHLTASARALDGFVSGTPAAQALVRGDELAIEGELAASSITRLPPAAGWLGGCIASRDQAESLLVALGTIALSSPDPVRQDLAASHERAVLQQAQTLDETARALGVMLGDEVRSWPRDAWFDHMATLEPEHWWMTLAFPRPTARRPVERAATASTPRALAPVLTLRLGPRSWPSPVVALAAHGDDVPPSSGPDTSEKRLDTLWVELSSVKEPDQAGVMLTLWLTDDSPLDLSGESVQLLDLSGQPLPVISRGPKPRRWWAHFQTEGTFLLQIAGLAEPIPLAIKRGE